MFRDLDQRKQNFYKKVTEMITRINQKRSTIKTEIYKTPTPKRYHALVHKVLLNYEVLKEIVKKTNFMKNIPLGCVIAHEILTKNIRNDGFKKKFEKILGSRKLQIVQRKIYVRINTLKGNEADLSGFNYKKTCIPNVYEIIESKEVDIDNSNIEISEHENSSQICDIESYEEDVSYEDQLSDQEELLTVSSLNSKNSFKPTTELFRDHDLAEKIKIQNFSSCLPAFVLNPEPNSIVIDATAAPGNKTTHLCSIMGNTGKILAFERNKERYNVLVDQVSKYGATNVEAIHQDFLKVSPTDFKADYILLDPSCSGSGIHFNYKKDFKRIEKLHNFQAMLLNHAFKFQPKSVVYSVCSSHQKEGEEVVKEALEKNPGYYIETIGNYTNLRGKSGFDFSDKVIRTERTQEGDIGFFVALFRQKENVENSTL